MSQTTPRPTRPPTVEELLIHWLNVFDKQFLVAKIAMEEMDRAYQNVRMLITNLQRENLTKIKEIEDKLKTPEEKPKKKSEK